MKQKTKHAWGKKYNNLPETTSVDVEMAKVANDNIENVGDNNNEHNHHKESLTHALDLPPPWEIPGESDRSLRPQSVIKSNQKKKTKKKNQRKKEGDEPKKTVPTFQSLEISSDINEFNYIRKNCISII